MFENNDYNLHRHIKKLIDFYNNISNFQYYSYEDTCDIDKSLINQLKKSIVRLFNKRGKMVHNENENTVYKKIEIIERKYVSVYRYYPNGGVYSVTIHGKNNVDKYKKKESFLYDKDVLSTTIMFLDSYNIPPKMQELIDKNKDIIIEKQKKENDNKRKREAIKNSKGLTKGFTDNLHKFVNYHKAIYCPGYRNGYNDFLKFQAIKWYGKDAGRLIPSKNSSFFTNIFPPNMYKIYETLNKINETYNVKHMQESIFKTINYKDIDFITDLPKYIKQDVVKYGFDSYCIGNYQFNEIMEKDFASDINVMNKLFDELCGCININSKMFFFYTDKDEYTTHIDDMYFPARNIIDNNVQDRKSEIMKIDLKDKNLKPVSYFMGTKDRKHFDEILNKYIGYYNMPTAMLKEDNAIKLDKIKLTSQVRAYSDKSSITNRYETMYIKVNNYIPNNRLYFFCKAYKNFIEQVKACEFGEEWLKLRGFIAPDSSDEKETKVKKEAK